MTTDPVDQVVGIWTWCSPSSRRVQKLPGVGPGLSGHPFPTQHPCQLLDAAGGRQRLHARPRPPPDPRLAHVEVGLGVQSFLKAESGKEKALAATTAVHGACLAGAQVAGSALAFPLYLGMGAATVAQLILN